MKVTFTSILKFYLGCLAVMLLPAHTATSQVLYTNGPIFNSAGTGPGGTNQSVLYSTSLGMSTIGFGHQLSLNNRVADDFFLTACNGFRIDSIAFFGYQTGSTTTSTFTGISLRIWDTIPTAAGATVLFGDTTTNIISSTGFSGTYRVTETTLGVTNRPIMRSVCNLGGVTLTSGSFWLDWSCLGSLASGPWAPPITPSGVAITGNALQRTNGVWNNAVDGGTGTPHQGFPFVIYGTLLDPIADAGADVSVCEGSTTSLGGAPAGINGIGPLSYAWSPSAGLSDSTAANPALTTSVGGSYQLLVTDSLGCFGVDTVVVTTTPPPADFLSADTTLCAGSNIQLTTAPGLSFLWSTGDTTQSVMVGAGTFSVSLTDSAGCVGSDTVVVSEAIAVEISGDEALCPDATGTLSTNIASGSYFWTTGDTTAMLMIPVGGIYGVSVTDAFGCVSSDSIEVADLPAPIADLGFIKTNLTYAFSDFSAGNPTAWRWTFGDGDTSSLPNPVHTYATGGLYVVTLIITNDCGNDTTTIELNSVSIDGGLGQASIAIMPMPSHGQFTFEVAGISASSLNVQLIDMNGRTCDNWHFTQTSQVISQSVNASELAKGIYLLRFSTSQGVTSRRIVLE